MNVYIDMDGVVARWIKGVAKFHGLDGEEIERDWPCGVDAVTHITSVAGISKGKFWQFDGYEFYAGLEHYSWMDSLVGLVNKFDHNWHFLTSPTMSPGCWSGKAQWLKDRGIQPRQRLIIAASKERLARNSILIDDTPKKLEKFIYAGGQGILFPAPWNGLICEPLDYIEERLCQLKEF